VLCEEISIKVAGFARLRGTGSAYQANVKRRSWHVRTVDEERKSKDGQIDAPKTKNRRSTEPKENAASLDT
jgi:hypothetical protein